MSHWLPIFLVILSNDVHFNPGPHFQNNFFNFMTWNANSLVKDNFERVRLIQAHNSIFNYDISICETSLNDSVVLPETTTSLCLRTIHQTLGMGELGFFLRIACLLLSDNF